MRSRVERVLQSKKFTQLMSRYAEEEVKNNSNTDLLANLQRQIEHIYKPNLYEKWFGHYKDPTLPTGLLVRDFATLISLVREFATLISKVKTIQGSKKKEYAAVPPENMEFILHILLSRKNRKHIIGDLEEAFHDIILPKYGAKRARQWYRWQALRAVSTSPFRLVVVFEFLKKLAGG